MNESDETAQAAGYKAGDVISNVFIRVQFLSFLESAKACGNDRLAIYFMPEVLKKSQNFRGENEEVLKFYGGNEL